MKAGYAKKKGEVVGSKINTHMNKGNVEGRNLLFSGGFASLISSFVSYMTQLIDLLISEDCRVKLQLTGFERQ